MFLKPGKNFFLLIVRKLEILTVIETWWVGCLEIEKGLVITILLNGWTIDL